MQFPFFYFGTIYHPERYPHDLQTLAEDASLMQKLHMSAVLLSEDALSYALSVGGGAEWLFGILDLLGEAGLSVGIEIPGHTPGQELLLKLDGDARVFFFKTAHTKLREAAHTVRTLKAAGIKKPIALQLDESGLFSFSGEQEEADLICFSRRSGYSPESVLVEESRSAFLEDRIRAVKREPYMLVDLDPMFLMSDRGKKLRPGGTLSMEIFQAAFHGARGCFLSDLRQAVSGDRRYDGAVVSHSGRTDTRICEEVEQIGRLLTELTEMTSTKVAARCAVLCGDEAGKDRAFRIWRSLRSLGTSVDVIDGSMDYEGYAFVAACGFRRVSEENAERIRSYIEAGGIFLAEWGFATEDLNGSCYTGEVPHSLTDVFGIRIAETEYLYPDEAMPLTAPADFKIKNKHKLSHNICEIPENIDADIMVRYEDAFFKGQPALSRKKYGKGFAYYMATDCSDELIQLLCDKIIKGLRSVSRVKMTEGIAVQRLQDEVAEYLVFQNFLDEEKRLPLDYNKMDIFFGYDPVPAYGVLILRMNRKRNKKEEKKTEEKTGEKTEEKTEEKKTEEKKTEEKKTEGKKTEEKKAEEKKAEEKTEKKKAELPEESDA